MVREQIEASFKSGSVAFDFRLDGLVVWPESRRDTEVFYPLRDGEAAVPLVRGGNQTIDFPALRVEKLLFKNMPIFWKRWVELWEADQAGEGIPTPPVEGLLLIPDRPGLARPAPC